jgi:hypothetical protein
MNRNRLQVTGYRLQKKTKNHLYSSERGFSSLLILVGIGIIAAVAVVFFGFSTVKKQSSSAPQPSSSPKVGLSSESSPASIENDPAYNLVKEKFDLNEKQLEILSRVSDNDNKL